MNTRICSLGAICLASGLAATASADIANFRQWVDANGLSSNSASNTWYATCGWDGPLMTADGSAWRTEGEPFTWPMFGPLVEPGSYGGAAGPATFAGLWARPGPNHLAVIHYNVTEDMVATGMTVQSELIANGMSGNGVIISAFATIGGEDYSLGTVLLANSADARLDVFSLIGPTLLSAGDSIRIAIGNNDGFLYDHVNFNAWLNRVPGPGGVATLLAGGLMRGRRRRS